MTEDEIERAYREWNAAKDPSPLTARAFAAGYRAALEASRSANKPHGCICPPGAENGCCGPLCPRHAILEANGRYQSRTKYAVHVGTPEPASPPRDLPSGLKAKEEIP